MSMTTQIVSTQNQAVSHSPRTFKLSSALLDKMEALYQKLIGYQPQSASEIILYALLAHSGKKINVPNAQEQHFLRIPDSAERLDIHPISVRIPDTLYADLKETATQHKITIQEAVTLIMIDLLTQDSLPRHVLRIPGSKRDKRMLDAITEALDKRHYDTSIEPCGGALEIHLNLDVADTEIVCDIDPDKIDLYKVLQAHHKTFVKRALALQIDSATFNMMKESEPTNNIDKAVRFFYLNLNSARNTGETFDGITLRTYWNAIAATYALHARLQNTQIHKRDIFKTLSNRNLPDGRTLLLVDPPYLKTKAYRQNLTSNDHSSLATRLLNLCRKGTFDLVYFCRITDGHDKTDPEQQALKLRNDIIMKGRIDDLYYNHGLFFKDIPLDHGIIERIITSFYFKGSTPYGRKG